MAWRRPGDKPLSEPMMASLLTHICVTRPQWVNKNTIDIATYKLIISSGILPLVQLDICILRWLSPLVGTSDYYKNGIYSTTNFLDSKEPSLYNTTIDSDLIGVLISNLGTYISVPRDVGFGSHLNHVLNEMRFNFGPWEIGIKSQISDFLGSDNGLVPSGKKPLLETMLTQFHVAIWCH